MLKYDQQPRNSSQMIDAYDRDLDVWGNGETRIFEKVVPSLMQMLETSTSLTMHQSVKWCDLGCGPGYFLDAVVKYPGDYRIHPSGCDISKKAVEHCKTLWPDDDGCCFSSFYQADLDIIDKEGQDRDTVQQLVRSAEIVSLIDVLYYLVDYRRTFDALWQMLDPGTVVVISDVNIRYHRRVYPKKFSDALHLASWADATVPMVKASAEMTSRYMKYAVYMKSFQE